MQKVNNIFHEMAVQYFIGRPDCLTKDPPTNGTKDKWIMEDRRLFGLLGNTWQVESKVIPCIAIQSKNYRGSSDCFTLVRTI